MALPTIPTWTFQPNWREGITESLSWLTDVLGSTDGTEQRRALRLSPRRVFEMLFNPTRAARSYFGLFLHRLAADEFMLPLFHDKALISADIAISATALSFDNTYREFVTGGYAVLLSDPFTFEVVEITAQTGAGLTVAPTLQAWPAGTAIYPLRQARLSDDSAMAALTGRVGQATIQFELNQANDFDEGAWTETYTGLPLISKAPNRREQIDLNFSRRADLLDNATGLSYLTKEAERAFTVQMHSWMIRGRQEHAEFRSMLYRLAGRWKAAWLPTFNEDLTLARPTTTLDNIVNVEEIGYGYTGGIMSGRNHIMLRDAAGTAIPRQILAEEAPLAAGEERFTISAAVGANLAAGASGSFLEVCRLDQDTVEIHHLTTTDGVSECKAAFRSFLNERVEDALVVAPMPSAVMNALRCGDWDDRAICFVLDRSGSMAGVRLTTMKAAMTEVLDLLSAYVANYVMDIGIVAFSSGVQTITRRTVSNSGINDLTAFVNGLTASGGTDFEDGMTGANTFMTGTDPALTSRFIFFVTDGEPAAGTAVSARAILDAMTPVPECYGINIVLANTTSTAIIDNTPSDGVPVVSDVDSSGLIDAVLGAF